MAISYDGTWFDLHILSGPHGEYGRNDVLMGKSSKPGADYTIDHRNLVDAWNSGGLWTPKWAGLADRIQIAFTTGGKAETLAVISGIRKAEPAFAQAHAGALDVYKDWARG